VNNLIEMLKSSVTSNFDAGKQGHPTTNEQNTEHVQVNLRDCRITTAEIAARLGINVVHPWWKTL
jgi:hypothetical protein